MYDRQKVVEEKGSQEKVVVACELVCVNMRPKDVYFSAARGAPPVLDYRLTRQERQGKSEASEAIRG